MDGRPGGNPVVRVASVTSSSARRRPRCGPDRRCERGRSVREQLDEPGASHRVGQRIVVVRGGSEDDDG